MRNIFGKRFLIIIIKGAKMREKHEKYSKNREKNYEKLMNLLKN